MGGSAGDVVNTGLKIVNTPFTGGMSLFHSKYNPLDKGFDPLGTRAAKQSARTAADQQKDAMLAQEADLKQKKKEALKTANNLAIRQRLIAQRGYTSANSRGGTVLTTPAGIPGSPGGPGSKTLLGS